MNRLEGLSQIKAEELLKTHGYNELPSSKPKNWFNLIFETISEPMILILVVCSGIYFFIGSKDEGLLLSASVFVIIGISTYQERRADQALKKLKQLTSPRALVVREGMQQRIAGREVVPGDLVVLHEGDRVVADGHVVSCQNLNVDESLLTGESVSILKKSGEFVYLGSLVVGGSGFIKVANTGLSSQLGKIGKMIEKEEVESTLLQQSVDSAVKRLSIVAIVVCIFLAIIYGVTRGDWKNGILSGFASAMSLLPEEFPVVLTMFLALGAWRLSKVNVLTRKPAAIEGLGSATVLCVDKTGTLTENRMTVKELWTLNGSHRFSLKPGEKLSEEFHEAIEYAVLASHKEPFDPIEIALRKTLLNYLETQDHEHPNWVLLREYPLSPQLLAMSCVWESPDHAHHIIAAKGAPEAVVDLCHLDSKTCETIFNSINAMANRGLRVLAVAKSRFDEVKQHPSDQHDFDFKFLGLIGFEDPLRAEVPDAISLCRRAGIRTIMLTGDHVETAKNIASQAGLFSPNSEIISGNQLEKMTDAELQKIIGRVSVFARMVPQDKLRIVEALKANGEIVAMTGDGVNDAPSLKRADIGIAMGARGTDVAREASDLVLLDDRFSSIVDGVRMGRRIFANIQKSISFLILAHLLIAGVSLIPVVFGLPIILFPVHLVFLELIIDPVSTLVFESEPEDANLMSATPKAQSEMLVDTSRLKQMFIQGLFGTIIICGSYYLLLKYGFEEKVARGYAFSALILANLGIIINLLGNKSGRGVFKNMGFVSVSCFSLFVLGTSYVIPYLGKVFLISPPDIRVSSLVLFSSLIIYLMPRLFLYKKKTHETKR